MQRRRFPIGIQDFPKIRTENFHYVDKTDLIYQLTQGTKRLFKVGINFSMQERTVTEWKVVEQV